MLGHTVEHPVYDDYIREKEEKLHFCRNLDVIVKKNFNPEETRNECDRDENKKSLAYLQVLPGFTFSYTLC